LVKQSCDIAPRRDSVVANAIVCGAVVGRASAIVRGKRAFSVCVLVAAVRCGLRRYAARD
jgi:hypothetical protein